jgi:hypothetical protein
MEHKYNAKQEESILPTQYLPWKEVFEQKAAERFPGKRPWDHAIELRDDFKPKKGKIYPLNPLQQNTLDEWIKEQLVKGYIRPSKSPQASPFFFVEKKDAKKLRPCQDYRYLNEFTKPNAYPLLLISDLMITLKGSKCYNMVRTPTLCKPDTSDRPYLFFSSNLLNLATPLLSYAVRLVLLTLVLLSSLPCYLYDAVLILTSDILYSLIDTFLSILRYISTHVFVVEP